MATLSRSESRRLYSWWWDSHISPRNSKWLQENLSDMDTKVRTMIKLIEEDADSFARRAEMYYKKRPELMKLVEEFYRAYRALAERYDHATVELRQAHRTMAEAFPNQAHYMLTDDSLNGSSVTEAAPQKPEVPRRICAFLEPDDLQKEAIGGSSEESDDGLSRKGLRQLNEIFVFPQLSAEKHNVKTQNYSESEHGGRAENEVQRLRKALAKVQSDKDAIFLKYQKSLEKLSEMEREIDKAQKDAGGLDERASKAEIEIKILKEALAGLKAEKEAGLVQHNQCLERIASLETMLSLAQLNAKGLDERAAKAETEANNLKQELARLEVEKDAGLLQCKQCFEKISLLEAKITLAEENSWMLNEQIRRAELEVKALRRNLSELNEEKESAAVQYQQCLEKISKMETEILHAQENSERLNREIEIGAEKLKSAEKHCDLLKKSNQSLQLEADNLVQKIAMKDQELLEKHTELERLQTLVQEEHSHFLQIESTLQTLQNLYTQSQEEQKSLSLELKYGLQLLKDSQFSRQGFKEEMQQIVEENKTLHELNFSFTRSLKNQQMEISKLTEIKEKLEREFAVKAEESNALQLETQQIKDEIQVLNNRYQTMLQQLQTVGLNPKCFAASVKDLQNENSKLKEVCKMERTEKEAVLEKSNDVDKLLKENAFMEFSLSELNDELEGLRGTLKKFQESSHVLQEEKSNLVAEKSTLLSQLQIITEIMQKLFEKNTLLEKSLSDAKIELEGLKAKSSSLEELCKLLNDQKYNLLNERSILVSQLESVEARLGNLEKRFTKLEEKYSGVEKDKETTVNQVKGLHASLLVQKERHANHKHSSEARLANLENLVHLLEEGQRLGKLVFEEELDKAVNAQVEMFILQSFVEDLEQKNLALLTECEKHVEASKFSDKVISELESENLMQLVELELLLDEIRKFKMGIRQVCEALRIDPHVGDEKAIKQEEVPISHILDNIEGLKGSLVKSQEEKQQLLVENSVLLTSLWQHQLDGEKLESRKKILEQEFENMREQHAMLQKDKLELLEMNRQLRFEATKGEEKENTLKSTLAALHAELVDLQRTNLVFQEEKSKVLEEKNLLLERVLDLKDALSAAEDENSAILHEVLALSNLSLVYECFATEKALEQKALSELLSNLSRLNSDLKQEMCVLRKKSEVKEAENAYLDESIERMGKELQEAKNANGLLSHQIANSENLLKKKETELFEMEERLQVVETLNAEFCRNVEELKIEQQESRLIKENLKRQILERSEDCINHKMEIENLSEENKSLLSEMRLLHHEVEQNRFREETSNSVLLEKTNEFELWEAEAATFYFDLQISSISEALLENKVDELNGVCKSLEDESAAKSLAIEQMTERVSLLESEIGELKGQLSAYIPVISSLKEDFASLEHTSLLWTNKTSVSGNGEQKEAVVETSLQENSYQSLRENESTLRPDGVSDLLSMQTRIRAVARVMMEEIERQVKKENLTANVEGVVLTEVTDDSNLEVTTYPENDSRKVQMEMELKEETAHDLNSCRTKSENGSLMKDIPLDHNSDNSASKNCKREQSGTDETAEQDCSDNSTISEANKQISVPTDDAVTCHRSDNSGKSQNSSSELEVEKELGVDKLELSKTVRENTKDSRRRKILERLASDAQKLSILKITAQDLKKKPETKTKSKKGNGTEYETVNKQIEEVEEAVVQLLDMNHQLTKDVEESTSSLDMESSMEMEKGSGGGHIHRRRVTEQARRGSEQIGRLQFEVQNIQYVLLKLADENNNKGKNRFSGGTGVLLSDFIYNEKKRSKRRSKGCFWGCSRPSTSTDEE